MGKRISPKIKLILSLTISFKMLIINHQGKLMMSSPDLSSLVEMFSIA